MLGLQKIFGDRNSRKIKSIKPLVEAINAFESTITPLSDDQLAAKTLEFKSALAAGKTLDDILPEAYAVVREASKRTLGQRHYDVQLIGGIVMHQRSIAEMKTGEGKTLVATLPTYLNALTGNGVHVVTVNDYLSRRDAVWMGQIYAFLGLSVSVINHDASYLYDKTHQELDKERDEVAAFKVVYEFLRPCTRKEAYAADITYGTNNEFGFDYLRDNLEYNAETLRQRGYAMAIVDEIDSILIDESRTPLIISAPTTESENLYVTFAGIAEKLHLGEDYEVDEKRKAISLTDSGINKAEKELEVENIYTDKGVKYVHHLETAVKAKALYKREKEYVVKNDEIVIVDEFTGRMQPGRRWSDGLHQAIEAKEKVTIQKESRTYASITFQNYFRMYGKLAGMTGTGATSQEEFFKVYGLDVVTIPTHRPIARLDRNDQIFQNEIGKFKAVAKKVKEINTKGQPVLVGTVSIEKNELLSEFLKHEGITHEVLNAKNHEREGEIIAMAGKSGAVTIATNLAGRGVDIKLGGPEATETEREAVKNAGGLFVLGTERHEARRIDNQLRGRSGRQGDPGETQFFVSLEDSLMRIFASGAVKSLMGRFGIPEDQAIENKMINRALETAQKKIEGFHFDARKHTLEYDDVLNFQRKTIYERRRELVVSTGEKLEQVILDFLSLNKEGSSHSAEKPDTKNLLDTTDSAESQTKSTQKVIDEIIARVGKENFYTDLRRICLQNIDAYWVDHLEAMDYLRQSVTLRAYGQRDPLIEYKREGLRLFKTMEISMRDQIISLISLAGTEHEKNVLAAEQAKLNEVLKQAQLISGSQDAPLPAQNQNTRSQNVPQSGVVSSSNSSEEKKGRNERVTIVKDGAEIEIKFKKLDQYISQGWIVKE